MELRSPSEPSTALGDDEPDALAEVRQRTRAAFADAAFLPCGLDTQWVGTRWFGGSGTSNGDVTRLELAHGEDPWDESSTQVRLEVRLPRRVFENELTNVEIEQSGLTRELVSRFWMETGKLDPEVRAAAFPTGTEHGAFTAPWAEAEIAIDGESLTFRRLGDDAYWLAHALHGRLLVGIESRKWPPRIDGARHN
jgi:hypothetical protein